MANNRLRIVRIPDEMHPTGTVLFGDSMGQVREEWHDGVVVMLGNECAPDHVTVWCPNGEVRFYSEGKPFTPRVSEWADCEVHVLYDSKA